MPHGDGELICEWIAHDKESQVQSSTELYNVNSCRGKWRIC